MPFSLIRCDRSLKVKKSSTNIIMKILAIVRTYIKQIPQLLILLPSIHLAANNSRIYLTTFVLNTGLLSDNPAIQNATMAITQVLSELGMHPQIELKSWVYESKKSYGYVASDVQLKLHIRRPERGKYILFCNGDTYYTPDFFQEVLPFMKTGVDLIATSFVPSRRHAKVNSWVIRCRFKHGSVDLNGLLFRTQAVREMNVSFSKLSNPCYVKHWKARGCRGPEKRPYWIADWGMAVQMIESGATKICAGNRPLYVQN